MCYKSYYIPIDDLPKLNGYIAYELIQNYVTGEKLIVADKINPLTLSFLFFVY